MRQKDERPQRLSIRGMSMGVIGGGIAGCTAALGLADRGASVTLFERSDKLLDKSSDATPCRLGVGFHYMDLATAIANLEASIRLIRHLKESTGNSFQVQKEIDSQHTSVNRVHYVISNETLVNVPRVLEIFEQLRGRYAQMVDDDPENEVLGPVSDFYEVIRDPRSFQGVVDLSRTNIIIKTCETLFDWPIFKPYLIGRIYSHPNIRVVTGAEVSAMSREPGFKTVLKVNNQLSSPFDFVVNAAWSNVDALNRTVGYSSGRQTVNRVKCMAVVQLPERLKDHSFLVGYGPFCSLSSRADGLGYLTYEPVTNISQHEASSGFDLGKDTFPKEEERRLGNEIIKGASHYFPALADAKLQGLKVGIVRTDGGAVDIYQQGQHFNRCFKGVYPVSLGLIVNEARKHTYWLENMLTTLRIVDAQICLKVMMGFLSQRLSDLMSDQLHQRTMKTWGDHYFPHVFVDEEAFSYLKDPRKSIEDISLFCHRKNLTVQELKVKHADAESRPLFLAKL